MSSHEMVADNGPADNVSHSEMGVTSLLAKLKQSVSSSKDFAIFLKKRAILEDDQAQGLKKLSRSALELLRRPDGRQGSYAQQMSEMMHLHDYLAENGLSFALGLHQMHDDLSELINNIERGRKHWKQFVLSSEKKVSDAEQQAEKAKVKLESATEEYDRVRTGDRRPGKGFGLRGSRSGAQYEEDAHRRVGVADTDYSHKVQLAQTQRHELIVSFLPQAVQSLKELIKECDAGLSVQIQKYVQLNEKLALGNGLTISPMKTPDQPVPKSMRTLICAIDDERDFNDFVVGVPSRPPPGLRDVDVGHELHPSHTPTPNQNPGAPPPKQPLPVPPTGPHGPVMPVGGLEMHVQPQQGFGAIVQAPISLPHSSGQAVSAGSQRRSSQNSLTDLPRNKPVFGVPLDNLLARDESAVPIIVYQCIQAVDLYGLDVEGIYRLSGEKRHVERIKAIFDNDATCLDFRRPEDFFHDVNSAASILKQFFRELPEPLLTNELYSEFIGASKIDEPVARRDSLHGLINRLPDPNYATLRILALHLTRVQEHANMNRMNAQNLAICFGPTLMGSNTNPNIADAGWQVRVVETILQNCFSIFHDE